MVTNSVVTHNLKKVVQCTPIEVELMQKLRKGDQEALKTIFNSNFEKLYAFVFYEVGQNRSVAEDIVQETFFSAIKSASKFKGTSQIYTWLAGIAHHKIADYYRSHKIGQSEQDDYEHLMTRNSSDFTRNNDSHQDDLAAIQHALCKLPQNYQDILLMRFVDEMPFNEIALKNGQSLEATKSLFRRSIAALTKKMEGDNG